MEGDESKDRSIAMAAELEAAEARLSSLRADRASLRASLAHTDAESDAFHASEAARLDALLRVADLEGQLSEERAVRAAAELSLAHVRAEAEAAAAAGEQREIALRALEASLEAKVAAAVARGEAAGAAAAAHAERRVVLLGEELKMTKSRVAGLSAQLEDAQASAEAAGEAAGVRNRLLVEQNESLRRRLEEALGGEGGEGMAKQLVERGEEVGRVKRELAEEREAHGETKRALAALRVRVEEGEGGGGREGEEKVAALTRELEKAQAVLTEETTRFTAARRDWTAGKSQLMALVEEQTQAIAELDRQLGEAQAQILALQHHQALLPEQQEKSAIYTPVGDPRYNPRPPPNLIDPEHDALAQAARANGEPVPVFSGESLLVSAIGDLQAKIAYLEKTGWHIPAAGVRVDVYDEAPLQLATPAEALDSLRELVCQVEAVVNEAKAYRDDLAVALHEKHMLLEKMYETHTKGGMALTDPAHVKTAKLERALSVTRDALVSSRAAQTKPEYVAQLAEIRSVAVSLIHVLDIRDLRRQAARAAAQKKAIAQERNFYVF